MKTEPKYFLITDSNGQPGRTKYNTLAAAEAAAQALCASTNAPIHVLESVKAFRRKPVEIEAVKTVVAPQPEKAADPAAKAEAK